VEPVEGGFVCNLGDMLERMTAGRYRSTPHRVRPPTGGLDRLSCPFFFDPGWDVEVGPLPLGDSPPPAGDDTTDRWDRASVHEWSGTYGDYLTAKVAKVFPDLA
jgi:isopenicillin N synthase-like dioxygenase